MKKERKIRNQTEGATNVGRASSMYKEHCRILS